MDRFPDIRRRNLDALLGIADTGMLTVDRDHRVRSMNPEAMRLLGLTPEVASGLDVRELFGVDLWATGLSNRMIRVSLPDGPRDFVVSTVVLQAPEEEYREVAVSLRDVTEAERIRRAMRDRWVFHDLVCVSPRMKEAVSLVRETAGYDSTLLLLGESGTGKELVARAVHAESPRAARPFVTVNCSAYAQGLLESELFGHVAGAFTGATRDRVGRFEAASGGTVLLDEVGEIPPPLQVKLLRVLQERTVERVGDQTSRPVDIRIVAATNRDLKAAVRAGAFREDLYYRLNVIAVRLPPLRERREDVPVLAEHFLSRFSERTGKRVDSLSDEALDRLLRHDWPGNVRELENAVEHAVVRCAGPVVRVADLPAEVRGATPARADADDRDARIQAAMRTSGGRVGRAAGILGVHRTTLWRWLRNMDTP